MLSSVKFATPEDKAGFFQKIREAKISRHEAHRLSSIISTIFSNLLPFLQSQTYTDFNLIVGRARRINLSYDVFDNALRSASQRLPQNILKGLEVSASTSETCPVCMLEFEIEDSALKLPCDHVMHVDCAVSWLHRQASCPCCRKLVKAPELESSRMKPTSEAEE